MIYTETTVDSTLMGTQPRRPSTELPPFARSRLANLTHSQSQPCPLGSTSTAACCTISGSFCAACSYHGQTLPQSATSCSCASSACTIASQPIASPRAFVTVTLAANMRGGMWTQIVFEGKTDRVHLMNGRTISTRHSRGASRARCRDPSQRQRLADDYRSDDGEDASGKRCSSTVANHRHDSIMSRSPKNTFRSASIASLHSVRNRTALALVFTGRFFLLLRKLECSSRVFVVKH